MLQFSHKQQGYFMTFQDCPICGTRVECTPFTTKNMDQILIFKCPLEGHYSVTFELDERLRNRVTNHERALFQNRVMERTGKLKDENAEQVAVVHFSSLA
ncbi:hypothetical protein [Lelliottia wanjuensis]|uniref:hypothetical protein n=1 Tax=Lelliottia wanjuensis TaxID=3050585 RepID=UPI00254F886D|nr:hypothetical protein [Lelliottia sp. V86_10]MDK9585451.1 hypothetical protein [Lelliottia sp. V86_10]